MQSIESRDRQIGDFVERHERTRASIEVLKAKDEALDARIDRMAEITEPNFDRFATAMLGLPPA